MVIYVSVTFMAFLLLAIPIYWKEKKRINAASASQTCFSEKNNGGDSCRSCGGYENI